MTRKKDETAERRQKIRIFLCRSVIGSDDAVARLATRLAVTERVVRNDLEAIREEIESAPSEELSASLAQAIEAADSFKQLKVLGKRVMLDMVKGTIDRALGSALVEGIREQRQVLLKERDEESEAAVTALEILTPQEVEVLRKYRESLVPTGLKPGEFPAPPEGAPVAAPTPPPLPKANDVKDGEDAEDEP